MTDLELQQYYANLLILQYKGKAKAYDTILAKVKPIIMAQLPLSVQNAYNIDTAVGVQLDVLGKYAGVVRRNPTFSSFVTLNDNDFRILIKMKIIQNNAGSSLKDIDDLIEEFFPGSLMVFDNQAMQLSYFFNSAGSVELAEVFIRNDYLPRPMGVQITSLIYIPSLENSFAFRTYEQAATGRHGFNTYEDYDEDAHWIDYEDAVDF